MFGVDKIGLFLNFVCSPTTKQMPLSLVTVFNAFNPIYTKTCVYRTELSISLNCNFLLCDLQEEYIEFKYI
jgi:hypothetical protein